MRDEERRVLSEIDKLLSAYGIPYEQVTRKKHPAVAFSVAGKGILFTYAAGDHRAPMNARSNLRKLLVQAGAVLPAGVEMPTESLNGELLNGTVIPPPQEDAMSVPTTPVDDPVLDEIWPQQEQQEQQDPPPKLETEPAEASEHAEPPPPPPPLEPEPAPAPQPQQTPPQPEPPPISLPSHVAGTYQSGRVFAVKLERGLLVEPGNYLMVPLDRPTAATGMAPELFELVFPDKVILPEAPPDPPPPPPEPPKTRVRRSPEQPPPEEPAEKVDPPAPREPVRERVTADSPGAREVLTWLQTRRGSVKIPVIAQALGRTQKAVDHHLRNLQAAGLVESGPPGFWQPTKPTEPEPPADPFARNQEGVPPQMGRLMVGMAYYAKIHSRADVTGTMLKDYIGERDTAQFSARLPQAQSKGLVTPVLATDGKRAAHYQLTPKGRDIVHKYKEWFWTRDQLKAPSWITHL